MLINLPSFSGPTPPDLDTLQVMLKSQQIARLNKTIKDGDIAP